MNNGTLAYGHYRMAVELIQNCDTSSLGLRGYMFQSKERVTGQHLLAVRDHINAAIEAYGEVK